MLSRPRAAILAREGRYEAAEQWMTALIEEQPVAESYCLLGKIRVQAGNLMGAKEAFLKAIELDAEVSGATTALARIESIQSGKISSLIKSCLLLGTHTASIPIGKFLLLAVVLMMTAY